MMSVWEVQKRSNSTLSDDIDIVNKPGREAEIRSGNGRDSRSTFGALATIIVWLTIVADNHITAYQNQKKQQAIQNGLSRNIPSYTDAFVTWQPMSVNKRQRPIMGQFQ